MESFHLEKTECVIPAGDATLHGTLALPDRAFGAVLFAHGSGSSRWSPRNQQVAHALNQTGIATLLFDLLSRDEEENRANVFDIDLLAARLTDATLWLRQMLKNRGMGNLPLGYFGASTGAAAALISASECPIPIAAVVSRGGRPDLAGRALRKVPCPTLLIVGDQDDPVVDLNQKALRELPHAHLSLVLGATHLFEEPGCLEEVSRLAIDWFNQHFRVAQTLAA